MYQLRKHISRFIARLLPDKLYLSLMFRSHMGYWMDWENPRTFCEKIQWLKIYDRHEEYTHMVDKAFAKKIVASIIGEDFIIPTYGVFDNIDDINFEKLPNQFVLKCTHDSGGVVICHDKSQLNIKATQKKLRRGLKRTYIIQNREYPYKRVPRKIIAESFINDKNNKELTDYKFFCFKGRAEYCQVIANRTTKETIDFYDREWQHQPFIGLLPTAQHAPIIQHAPINYSQMLKIADCLSTHIGAPFVRIDLYNVEGHIYFGEITFFPASGVGKFVPQEWDYKLGEMIELPSKK